MATLNKIFLIGNLTRDPEIRYVDAGGRAVCKFSIAVNRRTKSGEEVTFLDIVAWEQLGERCNQHLRKGAPVHVEGRLSIRSYETKDGGKGKAVEIVASDVQFLGPRNGSSSPAAAAEHVDDEEEALPF
jgi:single-strand DNA-binding protein